MKESCCQFGSNHHLAGVLTEPAAASRRVACVLVNAGLVPKAGPFRLYAELARRLARDGFLTLRFDLGGIGDSPHAHSEHPLEARTELEVAAAVDYLSERHDLQGIVLCGLCSGAEDSFRHAERDPRVTGVVMVDPFSYRTAGWRWRHLLYRAARRSLRALGIYEPMESKGTRIVTYRYMDHAESSRILRILIDRGAHVHFVYTGGRRESFNHEAQLKAMFPEIDFRGQVTLDYFAHLEHTQIFEQDRRALVEAIRRRLLAALPS
jgi:pimeloyl-ACP methyl ester carboxylesterase